MKLKEKKHSVNFKKILFNKDRSFLRSTVILFVHIKLELVFKTMIYIANFKFDNDATKDSHSQAGIKGLSNFMTKKSSIYSLIDLSEL